MSDGIALESWLPIPGWESFYAVSDWGQVKSLARRVVRSDGRVQNLREKSLTHSVNPQGYHSVTLSRDGGQTFQKVHRLVLLAFVGPCPDGLEGCHGDGDPHNNSLSNLRWDVHSENMLDTIKHGTHFSASRVVCIRGHLLELPNLVAHYVRKRRARVCLACNKVNSMNSYRRGRGLPLLDVVEESNKLYELIMQAA